MQYSALSFGCVLMEENPHMTFVILSYVQFKLDQLPGGSHVF